MTRHELDTIMSFLHDSVQTIEFPGAEVKFDYISTKTIATLQDVDFSAEPEYVTKVSPDFTMCDIITLLSDGLSAECGIEDVDWDSNKYAAARQALLDEGWADGQITHEAIQTKMLMRGDSLMMYEVETHKRYDLTLPMLLEGLEKQIKHYKQQYKCTRMHAVCSIFDNGDFFTFNAIFQYAIFGDVIYG